MGGIEINVVRLQQRHDLFLERKPTVMTFWDLCRLLRRLRIIFRCLPQARFARQGLSLYRLLRTLVD